MKDTLAGSTTGPDKFKPYKFHTTYTPIANVNVKRASCILSAGRVLLIYDFPSGEPLTAASDEWFNDSVEVFAVGESIV